MMICKVKEFVADVCFGFSQSLELMQSGFSRDGKGRYQHLYS